MNKRYNSRPKWRQRAGFTLVELMLATVAASIVMMGLGTMMVGYFRVNKKFIEEEQTMQEIAFLSKLFLENARGATTYSYQSNSITFALPDGDATLAYDSPTKGVSYTRGGNQSILLESSVVEGLFSIIAPGDTNIVVLVMDLSEKDIARTNRYTIVGALRNF